MLRRHTSNLLQASLQSYKVMKSTSSNQMDANMRKEITRYQRPLVSQMKRDPDYLYWQSKDQWSLNEACKLICGRDPVQKYPTPQTHNKKTKVIEIIDLATEDTRTGKLATMRDALISIHIQVDPGKFVRWAIEHGFEVPPQLDSLKVEVTPQQDATNSITKDRILTIASTLRVVYPEITDLQIHNHKAMRKIMGTDLVSYSLFTEWLKIN